MLSSLHRLGPCPTPLPTNPSAMPHEMPSPCGDRPLTDLATTPPAQIQKRKQGSAAFEAALAAEKSLCLGLGGGFDSLGLIAQRLGGGKEAFLEFYEHNPVGRFFANFTGAGSGAPIAENIGAMLRHMNETLGIDADFFNHYIAPLFEGGSFEEIKNNLDVREMFTRKGNFIVSAGTLYKIIMNLVMAKVYRRIATLSEDPKLKQALNGNSLRGASYAFEKSGLFFAGITYNYMDGWAYDGILDNVVLASLCMGANHIGKLIGGAAVVYGNSRFIWENLDCCDQLAHVKEMASNLTITLSKALKSAYTLGFMAWMATLNGIGDNKALYGMLTQSTFDMPEWLVWTTQVSLAMPHAVGLILDTGYLMGVDLPRHMLSLADFLRGKKDRNKTTADAMPQEIDKTYHAIGAAVSMTGLAGAYYMASMVSDPVGWEFVAMGSILLGLQTAKKHFQGIRARISHATTP